tara:strand:- start:67 stop:732 length:666 start_codon:yes stop_codon:yes gene_type:complete
MTETGYTTSSRIVNYIIQEDGLESFKILRIKTFDTGWDAVNYETRFLIRVNAKGNTRFLNRSNNDGTFSTVGMTMTDATKKKISDANKGRKSSDEYREKMSKATAGTKNGMYGKTHSEETRKKISDKAKMRDPDSEETRKKKARHGKANGMYGKGHLISGENHFLYGKNHSDESKEKMRNHPSNKSVVVDGIEYISVSAAAKKLNVSRYIIDKLCKQQKGE